jgi:two-component system alkaline phosphatase synthesis response regulator PhoP
MSKGKLLILDDDVELLGLNVKYFTRLDFEVEGVLDGKTALKMLCDEGPFDVLITDFRMPSMDGLEVTRQARARSVKAAILILTAHDSLDDKLAGFEAGADDYLSKPYSPRELEHRVDALLRRRQGGRRPRRNEDRQSVGDLIIDKRRHEVSRAGIRIDLTPLEFQIIELLASMPGYTWSRNDLLDRVWGAEYEGYQRNIDPHINRLRRKIEIDPKKPHYVLTVRGVGYKLNDNP